LIYGDANIYYLAQIIICIYI